jgi:diaminohydroxyphosphoribosylaminopyrimidine deaminase/5-amino-6-(5-phosphoribosylamino)uracil reductase
MYKKVIRRCFDLGKVFKGNVLTNPLVGAVLMSGSKIVAEGAHEYFGQAHAEVNALKNVQDELLRKGTLFVSLEPCFHQGKTPPCVNLILQKKIPHVVIACEDPNPLVAGKSMKLLKSADIQVVSNVLRTEGEALIRPFVTGITQKRPYIILKYAQSADGYIGFQDKQIWLTNTFSKHLVHKWRSESDAVLVGANTAVLDNPDLTNRFYAGKKNNVRILLDRNLKTPFTHKIFNNNKNTFVLTQKVFQSTENVTCFESNFEGDYLSDFLHKLYEKQIGIIIVEGGSKVLQSFIDAQLWDEARVFATDKILGEGAIPAPILKNAMLQSTHQILNDTLNVFWKK